MTTETLSTLTAIFTSLGIPASEITESAYLRKDLQLDSTETVQISLELKRRLGVNVKLESRQDVTVTQIGEMIDQAMAPNLLT